MMTTLQQQPINTQIPKALPKNKKIQPKKLMLLVLMGVLLALLPYLVGGVLGNSWLRTLNVALLYTMLALGLNVVVGYAGLLDLGYIAFYALGAYLYALLASTHLGLHLSPWLILPLGALLACAFGVILGAPTLRLRGDYLAIVTLGFGEIVRLFMNNMDRPFNLTNGAQGIAQIDAFTIAKQDLNGPIQLFGLHINGLTVYYYIFLVLALLVALVCARLEKSRIGRAWVALREDDIAASAMGINIRQVKLMAFAIGASFGGIAGGLFAAFQGFVSPESFSLMESVMILCMVVLGGMGHIPGVILGAILLTFTPEILRHYAASIQHSIFGYNVIDPENLRMLVFGIALIAVMRFKPAGLWPSKQRAAELQTDEIHETTTIGGTQ